MLGEDEARLILELRDKCMGRRVSCGDCESRVTCFKIRNKMSLILNKRVHDDLKKGGY